MAVAVEVTVADTKAEAAVVAVEVVAGGVLTTKPLITPQQNGKSYPLRNVIVFAKSVTRRANQVDLMAQSAASLR